MTTGRLDGGLVAPALQLAFLTEADLTGQRGSLTKDNSRMPSRRRNAIDPIQLKAGDYVVHEQHGVGRYVEMVRRTVNGGEREYLIIEYAPAKRGQPGDRLFVPTDALDQVTKYVGGEAPSLNRLGGADWAKTKGRARKAVKEIAAELIRLYSARMATQGARVRAGHAVAARARGRVRLRRDARPAGRDRRGQGATWRSRCRWTASSAATSATARPRSRCGPRSRPCRTASRSPCWCRRRCSAHQHMQTFAERMAQFPVTIQELSRFTPAPDVEAITDRHRRRQRRHRDRHPPAAAADRAVQGPRAW